MQQIGQKTLWKRLAAPAMLAAPALALATSAQAQFGGQEAQAPIEGRAAQAPRFSPGLDGARSIEQGSGMQDVMAGRDLPLRISVKDLDASYRRLIVGGGTDVMSIQLQMIGGQAGIEMGLYFTRGETLSMGNETYLIAYRPQVRIDPEVFQRHDNDGAPAQRPKLRPNTELALSLLNLRSTQSLNDIRPFDRAQDIESAQESTAASTRNLERLGRGVLTWLNNRGSGTLPAMGATVTPALKRTFYPFVHDQRLWENPSNEQLYRPNSALSRRKVRSISNSQLVWIFAENTPASDGTRGVLFLDGHVERVSADRWDRIQRVQIADSGARTIVTANGTSTYTKTIVVSAPAN